MANETLTPEHHEIARQLGINLGNINFQNIDLNKIATLLQLVAGLLKQLQTPAPSA